MKRKRIWPSKMKIGTVQITGFPGRRHPSHKLVKFPAETFCGLDLLDLTIPDEFVSYSELPSDPVCHRCTTLVLSSFLDHVRGKRI